MYKKYPVAILHHHAKVVSMGDGLLTTHKLLAMATLAALLNAAVSLAQEPFPAEPIDIVTHASPGGGTDATARAMAVGARIALNTNMAVVPKTGGGGIVAMNYVNNRPRDGYTVLSITPTHLFAIARGQGPLSIDDLVGVARATDDPLVVMVRADSTVSTLGELIQLGHIRSIKWGTTQIGGVDHVAGAILAQVAETQLSVVPFSGGGEIVTNLMGGSIDAAGLNLTEALDQIQRGDFRALAVMADERLEILPDTPTTVELGYDVVFSTVRGFLVLKGTPEDRIDVLETGLLEGMQQETFQTYLQGSGLDANAVAGREIWDAQVKRLYADARQAMIDLGIIQAE
ncbi:MAG: tripartite tricarboxylate transporter substrate binding protein [Candidatus Rariloculaceae bacterium]